MSYSITAIIHPHEDKKGMHKILIQVIYSRMKVRYPTSIKIPANSFDKGAVIKHSLRVQYNLIIREACTEIEKRLMNALKEKSNLSKEEFYEVVKDKKQEKVTVISDFILDQMGELKGKLTDGRLRHYKVMAGKIEEFNANSLFADVSALWLTKFEAWLRKKGLDGNTVLSNMNLIIGVLNKAVIAGLINKDQFQGYKRPKYEQKQVEYLTEEEINKLFELIRIIEKPGHKLAGYYYMLSCLTGYRIGDAKTFDYKKNMLDGQLVLRANKNKSVVSTPIFPRLAEVLDYIKDKPLHLSEAKVRQYVKELFTFVGVKKDISYHSSRHSYAMLLMKKGLTRDEVAELIGDTSLIAMVYARIHNADLSKKIMEKLG